MKKQILAGVLSATMVVGMGGVSVFAADGADDKTYNIGICQLVQHEALDAATQGFKDAITEELGDKVTFDEQNAQGDSNTCSTIITDFVSKNVDLILAMLHLHCRQHQQEHLISRFLVQLLLNTA